MAMRRFLLTAAVCGAVSAAHAADMPDLPILRGSYTDGLFASRPNWQGFYVGGQASYGSVDSKLRGDNSDMQATFIPPANVFYNWQPLGTPHGVGNGFGAFAGYNSQWDDVVVGLEANYIHDGFQARTHSTGQVFQANNVTLVSVTDSDAVVKLSDFGSLRIRGGYVLGCFLPYAFVGTGFGSQVIDRTVSAWPAPIRPAWTSDSHSRLVFGYSAGAGIDVMLVGGLFARAEYEYRRVTANVESNLNTVRLGLGYKF